MKKHAIIAVVSAAMLCLSACNSASPSSSSQNTSSSSEMPSAPSSSSQALLPSVVDSSSVSYVPDGTITDTWETKGIFTPKEAVTTEITSYKLAEGTDMENEVVVLTSPNPGPVIYIVASVHGDEIAGYTAANKLKNMELDSGTLYILSPANKPGADLNVRYYHEKEDLNRAFPGKADGTKAEQYAKVIYDDIARVKPYLVMDLHEARTQATNRDFLGSSLIYTTLDGIDDMFLDMHLATQQGELCAEPFNFFGPGPIGSLNNTVATNLKIPVITVETYRAYQLERRVEEQLAVLGYVFNYNKMA